MFSLANVSQCCARLSKKSRLRQSAQVPGVHKLRSQGSWGEIDTDLAPQGRLVNLKWSFRDGKFAERRAAPALPEAPDQRM
jgi:hypothetical protein